MPPSASALAASHAPTSAATTAAASPAVPAPKSKNSFQLIARSERKPTARPQAAEASTTRAPRRPRVMAGSTACQKSSAQPIERAARSVYGYATPPYAQNVTAVRRKSALTRAVRSS